MYINLLLFIFGFICGSFITYVIIHRGIKGCIFLSPSDDDSSTYDVYLNLNNPNDLVNKTVIQIEVKRKTQ